MTANRIIFTFIFIVAALGGGWFCLLPIEHTNTFIFKTRSGSAAEVFINNKSFGTVPVTISLEDLRREFDAALKPSSWPPAGAGGSGSSLSSDDYEFYIAETRSQPKKGILTSQLYVKEILNGKVTALGGVNIRVQDSRGYIGVHFGGGGPTQFGLHKGPNGYARGSISENEMLFMLVDPKPVRSP